jgi:hypothetical protein
LHDIFDEFIFSDHKIDKNSAKRASGFSGIENNSNSDDDTYDYDDDDDDSAADGSRKRSRHFMKNMTTEQKIERRYFLSKAIQIFYFLPLYFKSIAGACELGRGTANMQRDRV